MVTAIIWLPAMSFALMLRWTECANNTHLFHKSGPSGKMEETGTKGAVLHCDTEWKKDQRKKYNQSLAWPQQHAVRTSLLAHKGVHRMFKMCHWPYTAGVLMLLLYVAGVGCRSTAMEAPVERRQNIEQKNEESAQAGFDSVFGDPNATNRLTDLSASGVAKVFANGIAGPIKAAIPRSYSYTSVKAQLQMTGLFRPQDLTSEWRVDVRKSFAEAINIILAEDERCCSYPTDIAITSTCYPDYTGCISLVLRSRPQDCGDGRVIDPEGCDDANQQDGDGCSSTCQVERTFKCIGGSRFGPDTCARANETWSTVRGLKRQGFNESLPNTLLVAPQFPTTTDGRFSGADDHAGRSEIREYKNRSDVHTGRRQLLQMMKGTSIIMNVNIDYVEANAKRGNETMKVRHLINAVQDSDFMRRFQERMRDKDRPVVVSWTYTGEPKLDTFSGSPRQFYAELMDGRDMLKCIDDAFDHEDGTACAYMDYVCGMTLLGFFIAGLMLLSCMGFCCARLYPCCFWIGRPCGVGRQCGGALPTKRRKKNEVLMHSGFLLLGCLGVMSMTGIGYKCTEEVLFDILKAINALEKSQKAPEIFRKSVSNSSMVVKLEAERSLQRINDRLSGLTALKEYTMQANTSFQETLDAILYVQDLIEGFKNDTEGANVSGTSNPCTYLDALTSEAVVYDTSLMVWRIANNGQESPTSQPDGFHTFRNGIPAKLPNRRPAPVCSEHRFFSYIYRGEFKSCPCCRDCTIFSTAVIDAKNKMPSLENLERLNTPVAWELIGSDIDLIMKDLERATQLVDNTLLFFNRGTNGIKFGLRSFVKFMPALVAWVWGSTWFAVFLVLSGMVLDKYRYLYVSFFLGCVASVTAFFPIVGLGAAAVIPMSDFCSGIPMTGEDTSTFLKTFHVSGDIMDVNRSLVSIYTDCLTKPDGLLWNVVDLDKSMIMKRLMRYDLSKKVNPAVFQYALNTEKRDMTAAFSNHFDSMMRMTSDNKNYGYDSMPYETQATSSRFLELWGDSRVHNFQRGGVIQGSNPLCMIRQINTILSSAMNEQQLIRACNFRVASMQAQDVWKSYGGTDRLADACATPNADMYSDYLYGCCPEDRFWGNSRKPAQIIYDYSIYKSELQRRIALFQEKASDVGFHLSNIKRVSMILEKNLTAMVGDSVKAISTIADQLEALGNCASFNRLYEEVRRPLCDDLSKSMDAFWISCFLSGLAWIPFYFSLLRYGKIIMLKKGLGERRPHRVPKKGGGSEKVAPSGNDIIDNV